MTLVCENEIVIMYVDDTKVFSSRIRHSINGAHIGVFSAAGNASFKNITMKLPQQAASWSAPQGTTRPQMRGTLLT